MTTSRQHQRYLLRRSAFAWVTREYPGEPRRLRRTIARAMAKATYKELRARETR